MLSLSPRRHSVKDLRRLKSSAVALIPIPATGSSRHLPGAEKAGRRRESRRATIAACEQGHRRSASGHDRALCARRRTSPAELRHRLGFPGEFPFTRGIQPTMYRGRLWTMRQYAGFATAGRIERALPLPARAGRQRPERRLRSADADGLRLGPSAGRRRGRPGRRRDRLDRGHGDAVRRHPARSRVDVDDHQRDRDHPAGALRRGRAAPGRAPRAAVGHGAERHPQGVRRARHLHLPAAPVAAHRHRHLRVLRARAAELEHDLDQRLSHPRSRIDGGAGGGVHLRPRASPTCRRRSTPASTSTSFGQRLSFFFNAHNDFLEEIAKFRAARRLWARIMRDRFDATNPRAQQLRFHTQTAGSTLTAQQPDNNIVRVALQALAAVLGGTQSLHCNGRDEALALPTEESARIALRTQQIIAAESGVANTVDPVAGSYAIEALTNEIERGAEEILARIDRRGRHARGDRNRADPARDSGIGVSRAARHRRRDGRRRRRQPVRGRPSGAAAPRRSTLLRRRSRRRAAADRARPRRPRQPERQRVARRRSTRSRTRRATAATSCRRSSRPSKRTPPSARSPTRCARSSASTKKPPAL